MISINSKLRRAGEKISDLIQRDTYDLLANERSGNQHNDTNSLYPADPVTLHGRPTLNLSMRELRAVPRQAFRQRNLQILKLNGNFLQSLPFELARLRQLQELYLQNNKLAFFPAQVCGLINLQVLDFSYNDLTMLPYSIANLKNIRVLDLAYNNINILPASLSFLQLLELLDLDGNSLGELPDEVCKLSSLIILRMRCNSLKSLPKQLTKSKKLRELYLTGNRISPNLPDGLTNYLRRLDKLEIDADIFKRQISTKHDSKIAGCLNISQNADTKSSKIQAIPARNNSCDQTGSQNQQESTEYSESGDPIYNFTSFAFRNICRTSEKEPALQRGYDV